MSSEVYHDHLSKKKVVFEVTDNIFQLNEEFDLHLRNLRAMIVVAHTHEGFRNQSKLIHHHYFWVMEDELKKLDDIKQKFSAYLKQV